MGTSANLSLCPTRERAREIYIEFDGKRIAQRAHPDTPHARTWISLEPGWTVRDVGNYDGIVVEHHDALLQ